MTTLATDRIGTALLNGTIDEAAARERLLAGGGTERDAAMQLGLWRQPVVSFTAGSYAAEQADYDEGAE